MTLESFSETELAAYLRWRLPRVDVGEDRVNRLHLQTDGLPLFVVNAIDELDSGADGEELLAGLARELTPIEDRDGVVEFGVRPPA